MLTPRMQAQAIANALSGRGLMTDERGWEEHLKPRDFTDPWIEAALAVSEAEAGQERQALLNALKDHPERDRILAEIWAVEPPPRFPTFAELGETLPPITWLWKNWIPRGLLSLLGSVSGAGKSYLALDLARRIVEGTTWPDDTPVVVSDAGVIYVDAERIPRVHYDRLKAWGTDSSRIYPLTADMLPDEHPDIIDFSNPEDRYILVELANMVRPALIIVDSMGSISTKGENNVEDVREILLFLVAMAADFECGLLLLHHLRKRATGMQASMGILAIDDFRGSGHISQMARSVLALSVATDGTGRVDRNATRRLEVIKTNLTRYPEALGIDFVPIPGNEEFITLEPTEAPEIVAVDELNRGDECRIWLMELLQDAEEPLSPREIVEMGEEEGFSRRTIYRERKRLGGHIVDTHHKKHSDNCWVWED